MRKRDIAITASFFLIAFIFAVIGITIYDYESGVRNGEILDEATLKESALWTARRYGLEGEPTILLAEYLSIPKEKIVRATTIEYKPARVVYVVSIKGKIDSAKSRFLQQSSMVLPDPLEGMTLAVNATTGYGSVVHYEALTDLGVIKSRLNNVTYVTLLEKPFTQPPNYPPQLTLQAP